MPRINLLELDDDFLTDDCSFEPIRRSTEPVSGRHDLQRRAENGINRFRKERDLKRKER